jgi:hypothetical protein
MGAIFSTLGHEPAWMQAARFDDCAESDHAAGLRDRQNPND